MPGETGLGSVFETSYGAKSLPFQSKDHTHKTAQLEKKIQMTKCR